MDFITIDFETANQYRNSPCEIGLTFVEDNKIINSKSWLIKPKEMDFNDFNISIHGIKPEDIYNKPEFDEIWNEILPLIDNKFIIAHNASFDMSVLRNTLDLYSIPYPNIQYVCSYIFSKKLWLNLPSYGLSNLCRINGIELNHHRAESDSLATAKLALNAFLIADVNCIEDIPKKLKTKIGFINESTYEPSISKGKTHCKNAYSALERRESNPDCIFYGKNIVFTGTLNSMERKQAQQIITDIGGIICSGVNKKTDYLIVGQQDYRVVGEDGMSTKQENAIKLNNKGFSIETISEDEFLKHI